MDDENEKRKVALDKLFELGQEMVKAEEEYRCETDAWWNNLSVEDQQRAFFSVCSRLYRGEIVEQRSYRGVLYDVFGWGPEAYGLGMACNYIDLHNAIPVKENKDGQK
jgi:hypothetical protein